MDYEKIKDRLRADPKTWLITGVAGFIGSNLLEELICLGQHVIGVDSFSTGYKSNLDEVRGNVNPSLWSRFSFIEGDICNFDLCKKVSEGVDHVLHQAALGSVPRSIADPISSNAVNVAGFLNVMMAARDSEVKSFTYASSSSIYGDAQALPKVENVVGKPLSPYALTKFANELYAEVFAKVYDFQSTGLRYFNVFGERQDPNGAYAAVIPKWIAAMLGNQNVYINGDGETTRDFCYVKNVVQANILAATKEVAIDSATYNVAVGKRISLIRLFQNLGAALSANGITYSKDPIFREFREGDVRHSLADISKISNSLGYDPQYDVEAGIEKAIGWYIKKLA